MVKEKGIEAKEGPEAVKEAKKYFGKKPDLVISDVPEKTLNQFMKLAREEFQSKGGKPHYGFTLKHFVDFFEGKITEHSLIALQKADEAIERISKVEELLEQTLSEGKQEKEDPKVKTMLDGKKRRCF